MESGRGPELCLALLVELGVWRGHGVTRCVADNEEACLCF